MTLDRRADQLEITDVFRSFVRPTWRPTLSEFCKNLTGITQVHDIMPKECFFISDVDSSA